MVNLDYLYNPAAAKDAFTKDYFIDTKLGFQVLEHATILPHKSVKNSRSHFGLGGIVDNQGNYIQSSSLHDGVGGIYTPPPVNLIAVPKLLFISECFIAYGDMI